MGGSGVGVVVLKRLPDAVLNGDHIHAVIKGSAINNDGAAKASYTAPSETAQADVIATALASAGVDASTISYVECHGTGTLLGDPIELAALNRAFRASTSERNYCALGSVKTNIGHLDAAAGIAGLMKTVLALEHQQLPASLHFSQPNPHFDFGNSPFYVNTVLRPWPGSNPRRAGVSSFGIGGTNAHVILEEAPPRTARREAGGSAQLLLLSARSEEALDTATQRLATHLADHTDSSLDDVAFTTQIGRKAHRYRRIAVCRDMAEAAGLLAARNPLRVLSALQKPATPEIVFLFPGQGSQYVNMARGVYDSEPHFRMIVDNCATLLEPHLGIDLRPILFPAPSSASSMQDNLDETRFTQPALFVIGYAMAQLWESWGVKAHALVGHSIGEYVAACLAGVFSLEDALALVAARGRVCQATPTGAMLSVPLAAEKLRPLLSDRVSLAADNAPELCVASGPADAIEALRERLARAGVESHRLQTSHAFHSAMMEPALERFRDELAQVQLHAPLRRLVSNVTGVWLTDSQATDPEYWLAHLRETVRFREGLEHVAREGASVLIEMGPGRTLATFARLAAPKREHLVLTTLPHAGDLAAAADDLVLLLTSVGRAWMSGVDVDWEQLHASASRRRVPLPGYPFERAQYSITGQRPHREDPRAGSAPSGTGARRRPLAKQAEMADWFYAPTWSRAAVGLAGDSSPGATPGAAQADLVVAEDLADALCDELRSTGPSGAAVFSVALKVSDAQPERGIGAELQVRYHRALQEIRASGKTLRRIVYCSVLASGRPESPPEDADANALPTSFVGLLHLLQELAREQPLTDPIDVMVLTHGAQDVLGNEELRAEQATLLGLSLVVSEEFPHIRCRSVDISLHHPPPSDRDDSAATGALTNAISDVIRREWRQPWAQAAVAYRYGHRWVQSFEHISVAGISGEPGFREGGAYLITGGLGTIGLDLAHHLVARHHAHVVVTGRTQLPPRATWPEWLAANPGGRLSELVRRIAAIEALGSGEVVVLNADAADFTQMQTVFEQIDVRFGQLDGVVHAAGLTGDETLAGMWELTPEMCSAHFRAKVSGTRVLARLLRERKLDFCVLLSSLSTVVGGVGYAAYAAANSFMDAFVSGPNRNGGTPWLSIDLDGWQRIGPAAATKSSTATFALAPDEGMRVFTRLVAAGATGRVIVSTGELRERENRLASPEQLGSAADDAIEPFHKRPELSSAYVAPTTELEKALAEAWEELLGVTPIGTDDNFFELGGHSLLAIHLLGRLRAAFGIELPLRRLSDAQTVAQLGAIVEDAILEQLRDNESSGAEVKP